MALTILKNGSFGVESIALTCCYGAPFIRN